MDETTADLARIAAEMEVWDESATADSVPAERGRMASLARKLGRGLGNGAKDGAVSLADRLVDAAPRIKIRDVATLRVHHPGAKSAEELADRIAAAGARASGAVGAGAGAAAMMPVPPAMPVEIAAELLAVAAVEFKMIAELYEAYGQPAEGNAKQRSVAYLTVWSQRRGMDVTKPATIVALSKSAALRKALRKRLTHAGVRKLPSLTPFMIGAAAGAFVNRKDTARLAKEIRRDLRERRPTDPDYWRHALPQESAGSERASKPQKSAKAGKNPPPPPEGHQAPGA
ncbi:hypothetical protein [Streptacidiphilus sp. MAP12-20]|uniref:hypothetical protein n=1 Tax=Streptacidiphilus sp. MAP12-20 TaxID=3156299 RepID=UPI003515C05C